MALFIFIHLEKNWKAMTILPEPIKKEIKENYPIYNSAPPPTDDDRKNETSWTYFKKVLSNK